MPTCGECGEWVPERWLVYSVTGAGNLGNCEERHTKRFAEDEACEHFTPKNREPGEACEKFKPKGETGGEQ
ncbi:MAG TPA: hypothetical protein VM537_03345 [Anaerolineae bacterium]|nr:hypothetical protein [Anaerolineae bacterium]